MNRREFFKIVGTSAGAVAAAGCGQAPERILPYVIPPDNLIPGVAAWFSTVCRECPAGCGVIARNREGRVVKLEGNPDHPVNRGALCIRGQAALQGLYNPDRLRGPMRRDASGALTPVKWEEAEKLLVERLTGLVKEGKGKRIVVVSQLENRSLGRLLDSWAGALGARRMTYEPFNYEAIRHASRLVFGRDAIPHYALEEANVILSFGADFLESWLSPVEHARAFTRMHAFKHGKAGTFIHVEPRLSLTAANADEWVRNAPGTEGLLTLAILKVILTDGLQAPGVDVALLRNVALPVDLEAAAGQSGVSVETITRIARAFAKARPGIAIGGGVAVTSPLAVETQRAIHLLNYAAGNVGRTLRFGPDSAFGKATPHAFVGPLTQLMAQGEIDVLMLIHANPLFALPPTGGFAAALTKVPLLVSFSNQPDETTEQAHLILPDLHPLESWGDFAPREGVAGLMQPTMAPVFDSRAVGDVLLSVGRQVLGSPAGRGPFRWETFADYLKEQWRAIAREYSPRTPVDQFWEEALRRGGVWKDVATAPVQARSTPGAPIQGKPASVEGDPQGLTLLVYPSQRFYDGRGANKPWLQEAPDTMTQVTWDSWVEVPAEVAKKLGIRQGDLVKVASPHGAIELPAYVSESLHRGVVAIPIGQGHTAYGRYAKDRGANPLTLLPGGPSLAFLSVKVTLTRTGGRRPLAIPQATHDQDDREIAQHVGLGAARELELRGAAPAKASHPSMYPDLKYPEYRWGMAVDLDACTGCQACVIACKAENNVPVVGKEQVAYGRDMHWLRLERWQEGRSEHPRNLFLPMFCQHCEIAPCEPVCPVFAAYHTEEGLNAQIYNRCVGTRYCNNNCPYHVRRFNWWDYSSPASSSYAFPDPLPLQLNPDVTVRQLGVMEKCTMCVQRIVAGKDAARDEKRPVRDGEVQTACQQTCPTQAILFGNLKDPSSRVAKLSRSPRGYHVLEEIGTRPAVTYLKKVTRDHGKG
ncbi:MAG: molybdopterin-dependent oxidoreductase [Candidatus Rokubacteria bacterium]|nr:molybdopterin-dependent oxidoreductase [Candidatus Rokubacteria bacterium]